MYGHLCGYACRCGSVNRQYADFRPDSDRNHWTVFCSTVNPHAGCCMFLSNGAVTLCQLDFRRSCLRCALCLIRTGAGGACCRRSGCGLGVAFRVFSCRNDGQTTKSTLIVRYLGALPVALCESDRALAALMCLSQLDETAVKLEPR